MTSSTVTIWHCNAHDCTASAPEKADGWANRVYTHGCPEHAAVILAHGADVSYHTTGRRRSEVTTWGLRCACGWRPKRLAVPYSSDVLRVDHLAHVVAVTRVGAAPIVNPVASADYVTVNGTVYRRTTQFRPRSSPEEFWRRVSVPPNAKPGKKSRTPARYELDRLPASGVEVVDMATAERLTEDSVERWVDILRASAEVAAQAAGKAEQ